MTTASDAAVVLLPQSPAHYSLRCYAPISSSHITITITSVLIVQKCTAAVQLAQTHQYPDCNVVLVLCLYIQGKPGEGFRVAGGGTGRVGDAPESTLNEVHILKYLYCMF
jgi:hypothetical protein